MTIKELRVMTGLSQSQFSTLLNIPVGTIQEWEQGRSNPPAYVVDLIRRGIVAELEIS